MSNNKVRNLLILFYTFLIITIFLLLGSLSGFAFVVGTASPPMSLIKKLSILLITLLIIPSLPSLIAFMIVTYKLIKEQGKIYVRQILYAVLIICLIVGSAYLPTYLEEIFYKKKALELQAQSKIEQELLQHIFNPTETTIDERLIGKVGIKEGPDARSLEVVAKTPISVNPPSIATEKRYLLEIECSYRCGYKAEILVDDTGLVIDKELENKVVDGKQKSFEQVDSNVFILYRDGHIYNQNNSDFIIKLTSLEGLTKDRVVYEKIFSDNNPVTPL